MLWGDADRSHRTAGTDPCDVLPLVPRGRLVRLAEVGHFADTEDVATTAHHLRALGG